MKRYFNSIVKLVDGEDYRELLKYLNTFEFKAVIITDENRFDDVRYLRDRFNYISDSSPSVLELLVSLAVKCDEDLMYDKEKGERIANWFWMFLQNANITKWNDTMVKYNKEDFLEDVSTWVDIFINRKYSRNGRGGGIFPTNTRKDVRKLDLWYQMNNYISENFSEEFGGSNES